MGNFVMHPGVRMIHIYKNTGFSWLHACIRVGIEQIDIAHCLELPFCDRINTQGDNLAMKKECKTCTIKTNIQEAQSNTNSYCHGEICCGIKLQQQSSTICDLRNGHALLKAIHWPQEETRLSLAVESQAW